jgi:hypothetical protein
VDAGDLADDSVDFDGLEVESSEREHVGDVDGFIVDAESGRPYYVVVDAGGWFKSKHFLLPVGHARLESAADGAEKLIADISRDRIKAFPGFNKSEFEKFSADDVKRFNDDTCVACSVTTISFPASEPYSAAWDRTDYAYPDWWHASASRPDRMGSSAVTAGAQVTPRPTYAESARQDARDRVVAREAEPSPHFAGRAQPGDVIGFETGGEQTHVGDTAEDENKRRQDAEKAATTKDKQR